MEKNGGDEERRNRSPGHKDWSPGHTRIRPTRDGVRDTGWSPGHGLESGTHANPSYTGRAGGAQATRRRWEPTCWCQWQLKTARFWQLKTAHFRGRRSSGLYGVRTTGTALARCTERAWRAEYSEGESGTYANPSYTGRAGGAQATRRRWEPTCRPGESAGGVRDTRESVLHGAECCGRHRLAGRS